jgi:hypothetical protein
MSINLGLLTDVNGGLSRLVNSSYSISSRSNCSVVGTVGSRIHFSRLGFHRCLFEISAGHIRVCQNEPPKEAQVLMRDCQQDLPFILSQSQRLRTILGR